MRIEWVVYRPDALYVWSKREVREALEWYKMVMDNEAPAKFIIARNIEAGEDPSTLTDEELWRMHGKLEVEFKRAWREACSGGLKLKWDSRVENSFLDVKVEIARRMLRKCMFCERRCGVDRASGAGGFCGLNSTVLVATYFHHIGEEAPLVPSGTIFYCGCNFKCVYCQNWDISQEKPYRGDVVSARELALIQEELRESGARNINHVGGDPTPNTHLILESMLYIRVNVPQIWNSNFYMTPECMSLLKDLIDLWLPDFKYWRSKCAVKLSSAPRYREVVTRNLRVAVENGDMIIRHLVLPNHIECCTKPILEWIAKNLPRSKVIVNIMDQYRPEYLVARKPLEWREIARRVTREEMMEARRKAEELGLLHDLV